MVRVLIKRRRRAIAPYVGDRLPVGEIVVRIREDGVVGIPHSASRIYFFLCQETLRAKEAEAVVIAVVEEKLLSAKFSRGTRSFAQNHCMRAEQPLPDV